MALRRAGRALLFLLPLASLTAAQPPRFSHLSGEQGLSQSTVQVVHQDHIGFIWLGTEEGLNRYDGYTFTVFRADSRNPGSLPNDRVSAVHEDRQRRLWIGTDAGLALFDRRTETFARIDEIKGRVTDIVEDADGTLWFGVEGYGLCAFRPDGPTVAWYQKDITQPDSFWSYLPSALLRDRAGRLWIGTSDAGLELFQPEGGFRHFRHDAANPASLTHNRVAGLAEDPHGRIWIATYGGGVNVLDPDTGAFRHYRHRSGIAGSLGTDLATTVFVDRSGTVWIGTDGAGVQRYDAATDAFETFEHDPRDPGSLSQNVVRTVYQDRQEQIWIGTYLGGVDVLRKTRHRFDYYTHHPTLATSLSDPSVASFLETRDGQLWIGLERGWLNRFDRATEEFAAYRLETGVPGGAALLALHEDRRGRIWIGTYRGGLARFDPREESFTLYRHRPGDSTSVSDNEIWAIAEDGEGMLWLGTNSGLDRFDPETGRVTYHLRTSTADSSTSAGVRALLRDRNGDLWVATIGGLNVLRQGSDTFETYRFDDRDPSSLSHDSVVALHEDDAGRLWVGTFGGGVNLLHRATGKFTAFKHFPSNVIFRIEHDASGRLWVSTNQGLARFDPASGAVESFDLTNGLQSLQFHLGASLRTREGRLLFGSVDGFYDFDAAAIQPDPFVPPIVLTALRRFNEPLHLPVALSSLDTITLAHGEKVFSIEFAALDYSFPRRNQYAYLMEGFSDRWLDLGIKREVTFTSLPPGAYVFQVRASNNDGVWSERPTSLLRVVIEPPFWGTWWFRSGALALAVGLVVGGHRLRVKRLTADLAQRKRAEAALRQAEEKYRELVEDIDNIIFTTDQDGNVTYISPVVESALGYRPAELLGQPLAKLAAPEDVALVAEALKPAAVHLEPLELRVLTRAGLVRWYRSSSRPIFHGDRICGLRGALTDITERKHAEEALRESEDRYRRFFDEDLAGAFIAPPTGRILACNPAFVRIFGFDSVTDATSCDLASLASSTAAHEQLLALLRQERKVQDHELEMRRHNGQPVHVIANVIGSFDAAGNLTEIKGYVLDTTERKRLEDQLRQSQKMEAVGQLAGGVAHDFNNLLTAIISYSDLLLEENGLSPEARADVQEIKNAGQRAAALTRQLLAFSRRQLLRPRVLDLNSLVKHMEKMLQRLLGEDIRLLLSTAPDLGRIKADPSQIEQVIMNLAINARDAMPRGGDLVIETVNVTLDSQYARQHMEVQAGDYVRLTVSDTGCGMSADVQAHLFEPFFTTKGVGKGTGLGLSTVYGIVKQSSGHISVYSEPGVGTTFKVYLPRVETPLPTLGPAAASPELPQGAGTILLVEDNEIVRKIARQILQQCSYTVLEAGNGEEALRLSQAHPGPIDLLLTDVIMPGINGRELAEQLGRHRPGTRVLFMSGYTDDAISRHGGLGVGTALLEKPFTPEMLLQKVREALKR